MRRVEREHLIEVKRAVLRAGIIGKQANQPRVPLLVELGAKARDQLHWGLEINFVGAGDLHGLDARAEAFGQIGQDRLEGSEGAPPR